MQEYNPFEPPKSDDSADQPDSLDQPGSLVDASKGRRFGTLVIDYIGLATFGGIIGIAIFVGLGEEVSKSLEGLPDLILGIPIALGYYVFFEGLFARTPGKWIFGTKVVSESGSLPTITQVVIRTLCRMIPFEAFSFFGDKGGWHDTIPKTRVVRVRG